MPTPGPVGAENLCHLCRDVLWTSAARSRVRHVAGRCWPRRTCDDLRLVGLKLVFLIVTRAVSLLGLSRRESWWKDAEILTSRANLAHPAPPRPPKRHHHHRPCPRTSAEHLAEQITDLLAEPEPEGP